MSKNEQVYRGYRITPLGTFSMYYVQPPGSGSVPKDLSGSYTTLREVYIAIDRSFDKMKKGRGKKNGSETSTSSG